MPKGYQLIEPSANNDCDEGNTNVKRKRCKGNMLLAFSMCAVTVTVFLIAGGIICGAFFYAKRSDHTKTQAVSSSTAGTPTGPSSISPSSTASPTLFPTPRVVPADIANSDILNYMDTAYDPCEDFYQYSCGHWYTQPGYRNWGTINELALSNFQKIAGYLGYPTSLHDPSALKKAKYIYSACTNTDYIEYTYITKIKDFMIHKAGGWRNAGLYPANSWSINNSLYEDHYLGSTAFFQFWIGPDDLNSSLPVIRVSLYNTYAIIYVVLYG